MLIAVFGDIHGNLPALEAVIADAENLGVDAWVCLGDVAFRGPQPVECIEAVANLPGITQIVGNTDQWLFQGFPSGFSLPEERMQMLVSFREWALARLQPRHLERLQNARFSHSLTLDNREVLFFHSSPSSTESWLPSSFSEEELSPLVTNHTADVVVDGHIHTPFIRQVGGRNGDQYRQCRTSNRWGQPGVLPSHRIEAGYYLLTTAPRTLSLAGYGSSRPGAGHACRR